MQMKDNPRQIDFRGSTFECAECFKLLPIIVGCKFCKPFPDPIPANDTTPSLLEVDNDEVTVFTKDEVIDISNYGTAMSKYSQR